MRFAKVARYDQGDRVLLEGRLLFQSSEYEVYCDVTEQELREAVDQHRTEETRRTGAPIQVRSILAEVAAINDLLFEYGRVRSSRTIRPQTYW